MLGQFISWLGRVVVFDIHPPTLSSFFHFQTRPKMGKIDIDYEKLHDAFFRYQTKPKMSMHGELYYEGKEFETKSIDKKPGDLSDELRAALGMPVG